VGAIGGATETTIQMPLLTWKFTRQEGRPLPTNLAGWYRGIFAQVMSIAPITAVQVMVNGLLERLIAGKREPTDSERIYCSMGAGIVSALIYSPADLVTIQQQRRAKPLAETARLVMKQYGLYSGIYKGFIACAIREGIYTCGYLGLAPVFSNGLKQRYQGSGYNVVGLYILGSISAALIAATITHPVDTVKTCVQADLDKKLYLNTRDAFVKLYQQSGFRVFFKGYLARTLRLCGAFFIISFIREKAIQWKTAS